MTRVSGKKVTVMVDEQLLTEHFCQVPWPEQSVHLGESQAVWQDIFPVYHNPVNQVERAVDGDQASCDHIASQRISGRFLLGNPKFIKLF